MSVKIQDFSECNFVSRRLSFMKNYYLSYIFDSLKSGRVLESEYFGQTITQVLDIWTFGH